MLSPCLFSFYAEYIMQNARLDEAQAGIKIAGRNSNNLRYIGDITLMVKSKEELKSLLMKVKESEKVGLKLNTQKTKIMASGQITSNRSGNNGNSDRLYFGGLQFSSITQLCPTLCDPMKRSTPGVPVHHQLPEFTQTRIQRVNDAIQPSHPVVPFSSCPQSLPASESFPMS